MKIKPTDAHLFLGTFGKPEIDMSDNIRVVRNQAGPPCF